MIDLLIEALGANTVIIIAPLVVLVVVASIPFTVVRVMAEKDWGVLSKKVAQLEASNKGALSEETLMGKRWIIAKWRRKSELNEWQGWLSIAFAASPSISIVWALASSEDAFYLNWLGLTLALTITFTSLVVFSSITSRAFTNSHVLSRLSADMRVRGYLTVSTITKLDDEALKKIKLSMYASTESL